jgi:hypothetical protein
MISVLVNFGDFVRETGVVGLALFGALFLEVLDRLLLVEVVARRTLAVVLAEILARFVSARLLGLLHGGNLMRLSGG